MSKILLIGPAGTGKTHRLLDDFVETLRNSTDPLEENSFFILPSAEHTERVISLVIQRGLPGFFHRRITTLNRLIGEVFGIGNDRVASNVTRFLILRDIFGKNQWSYFEEVQQSSGFLNLMLSFLDELKESLVSAASFRERMNELKKLEPDLAFKYEALAEIYELYEKELERQGLRDRQDAIHLYREMKKGGRLRPVKFQKIWLDGFFDFSNAQLEYLRELSGMTGEITVTLTKDRDFSRRDLFDGISRTEEFLAGLGFERRFSEKKNFRMKNNALLHLEENLFASAALKKKPEAGEDVSIFEAIGMEGEIEMIAREIESLYRQGGYRFSDFALLFRQIGGYADIIHSVFSRYGIPVEIHEREQLQFAPMIRVVVSLFKIFRNGWKRDDLMRFLKSSYVRGLGGQKKDYESISQVEHWALGEGISQGRETWFEERGSAKKNHDGSFFEKKKNLLQPLAALEDALLGAKNFQAIKGILLSAVQNDFEIFKVEDSFEEFVRRDAATLRRLEALLDEIGASFSTGAHPVIDFNQVADRFFRLVELDLYSLHTRDKNQVQVYDISLARQKEYRVVFVAGLLEKSFPVQIKEDPVLSDWERELLNSKMGGTPLRLRLPRQSLERYLFYLAVTRTSERLYLTCPRLDLEGKESLPSYYIDEVKSLFAGSVREKKQELARPYPKIQEALDWRELEAAVVGELWSPYSDEGEEGLLLYLTNRLLERPESRIKVLSTFYNIEARLTDPAIREADWFSAQKTSPTKLERYSKCPFLYFSETVLKLKDSDEDENIKNKGIILHQVLENFFKLWNENRAKLGNPEKIQAFVSLEFEKALGDHPLIFEKKYQSEIGLKNLRETLDRFLEHEITRLEASPLQPRYFELSFGLKENGSYPAFEIEDGKRKILLRGKIDRIDVDAKNEFGLVIDYKSSNTFKKEKLELGTILQLPVYLRVIETFLKLRPVGGELYSVKDCETGGFYHEGNALSLNYTSTKKSALPGDEFEKVLERGMEFVRRFTREMSESNIAVRPRDPVFCKSYCSYSAVCRIEKWKLPFILEEIKEEEKQNAVIASGAKQSQKEIASGTASPRKDR